jgi:hypothetical protein
MRQKIYLLLINGFFIVLGVGQQDDLVQAARRGDTGKIEEILKSGIYENTHDSDGRTALQEAAATENVELFKLLVAAGADIHVVTVVPCCCCSSIPSALTQPGVEWQSAPVE